METLEQKTNRLRNEQEDFIRKSMAPTLGDIVGNTRDEIIKAKKMEIGAISTHGGVKVKKTAEGWVPVTEGKSKAPEGESETSEPKGEQSISEAAKSASEAALQNAIKNSPDSEVRAAAHRELERRTKEEKTEMFTKPEAGAEKSPLPINGEGAGDKMTKEDEKAAKKETDQKKKFDDNPDHQKKAKEAAEKVKGDKKEEKPTEKKDSGEKPKDKVEGVNYESIRQWSGDGIKDEDITGVMKALFDEGQFSKQDLKLKGATSPAHESKLAYNRVDYLYNGVRDGFWPKSLKEDQIKEIIWGAVMSNKDIQKSISDDIAEKRTTYKFIENQSTLLEKSHINEFIFNENFSIVKTGEELKQKFQDQLKQEVAEIKENSVKAANCLEGIGESPDTDFIDEFYWKVDGYEAKISMLPKVFKTSEGDKKNHYNNIVCKIVDGMIEVIHLNTLINTLIDSKKYKITVKQAAILGY